MQKRNGKYKQKRRGKKGESEKRGRGGRWRDTKWRCNQYQTKTEQNLNPSPKAQHHKVKEQPPPPPSKQNPQLPLSKHPHPPPLKPNNSTYPPPPKNCKRKWDTTPHTSSTQALLPIMHQKRYLQRSRKHLHFLCTKACEYKGSNFQPFRKIFARGVVVVFGGVWLDLDWGGGVRGWWIWMAVESGGGEGGMRKWWIRGWRWMRVRWVCGKAKGAKAVLEGHGI